MALTDTILITGTTGFIGFRTLIIALQAGYRVRVAVRSNSKADIIRENPVIQSLKLASDTLTFVQVPDITVPGAFDEAVKDVRYIIHVASPIPTVMASGGDPVKLLVEPAINGTLGILESAKNTQVQRIVVTSSLVSLIHPLNINEEASPDVITSEARQPVPPAPWKNPQFAYAASKIAALNEAEAWIKKEKPSFDVIQVHPSYVHGRNDLALTPEDTVTGTNAGILSVALGADNGTARKHGSAVHIDDVARVHVEALDPRIPGNQSFLLATPAVWEELPRIIAKHFPDAVKEGVFSTKGHQKSLASSIDTWKTEQTFGKLKSLEEQAVTILSQYLELKTAA